MLLLVYNLALCLVPCDRLSAVRMSDASALQSIADLHASTWK